MYSWLQTMKSTEANMIHTHLTAWVRTFHIVGVMSTLLLDASDSIISTLKKEKQSRVGAKMEEAVAKLSIASTPENDENEGEGSDSDDQNAKKKKKKAPAKAKRSKAAKEDEDEEEEETPAPKAKATKKKAAVAAEETPAETSTNKDPIDDLETQLSDVAMLDAELDDLLYHLGDRQIVLSDWIGCFSSILVEVHSAQLL